MVGSVGGGANMYENRRFEIAFGSMSGKGKPAGLDWRFVDPNGSTIGLISFGFGPSCESWSLQ